MKTAPLPQHSGQAYACNIGVPEASASWIAFLDDDDQWFTQKLEMQLETARRSHWEFPIVSCRLVGRTDKADFIWPIRIPREHEDLMAPNEQRASHAPGICLVCPHLDHHICSE